MAKLNGQLFARLALDYFDHPKIAGLSDAAIVAHLELLVYSRKYLTDGVIPMRIAMRFASEVITELASNDPDNPSVARRDDGSLILYGYGDFQETKEQVESRRRSRKESAEARWSKDAKRNAPRTAPSNAKRTAPSNAETETETELSTYVERGAKRASQLPESWTPTDKHATIATERGINLHTEAEKFRDWCGATGKTYKNHDLAFNGWLKRARPEHGQQLDRRAQAMLADRQQRLAQEGTQPWMIEP